MKLFEITNSLLFKQDNPGGTWLKNKREDNEYHKKTKFGVVSRFGPVTGYFNRFALLPVNLVLTVPGMRDEQSNVRNDDLNYLIKVMNETNKLPLIDDNQYAPFINVDQEGNPWMNEGNHRVMAANKVKWKYIPVEIRYFTGGEEFNTKFSPDNIKSYDNQAISLGYKTGEDFKGTLDE